MTTTISSLIEFLMALLADEDLQAELQADPEGVLSRYGLDSACGEDIRDAQPMVADQVGVHGIGGRPQFAHSDDPATEISVLTNHYDVTTGPTSNEYNYYYVDDSDIIITVNDQDTINIHADGDLTITDSFNEDNDIVVIDESYNQDNDGVDNKGGSIDDSVVAGDDHAGSGNSDDDVDVSGSHNDTVTETDTDLSHDTTVEDSFNNNVSDDDYIDVDVPAEADPAAGETAPTAVHESDDLWPAVDADAGGELDAAASVSG
jgi:hypothetical protein